ncbi:MAG: hypothetical protein KDC44_24305, partial [Phaeodactylibacter sp.]|nr:hypothetical protein [Phaeodactylibacter sp.]
SSGSGIASPNNFTNTGSITIDVAAASNAVTAYDFSNSGTIQGTGTFDIGLTNPLGGTFIPGNTLGTMTFVGDEVFSGTFEMEINGTTPDTEHDQIMVDGTATISGTLNATINYTPTIGDRIVIISATSISGTFTSVNPPLPGPWSLDYSVPGEVALVYDYTPGLWDGDAGDGLWNTAVNWDGDLLPTPTDDVVIDNGDAVMLASGTVTVQSIKLDGNSDLSVSAGATLNVIGTNFRPVDVRFCYSCVITNSGTINVDGGGRGIDTDSNLINNNGATINIINNSSSGIRVSAAKTLGNSGTITITGPVSGGLNVDNFYNYASGNFTLTDENSGVYADFFWNYGNFTLKSTADGLTSSTELANFSTGTLNISVGSSSDAISTPVFFNSGTVAGNGTYTFSNTQNHKGILAPGNSPGTMTFQGDQTFQAANTLQLEIDGTMPDTEHDQIIVNGTLTLDGTLDA